MNCRNRRVYYLIMLICLICLPFPGHGLQELAGHALIEALQQGGFNLYFRHEATNWSQQDRVQQRDDWLSCDGTRIRQLSEEGRQRAKATGDAMRSLNIPVSEVLASPYCRTMDTARQLNLGDVQTTTDVINLRVAEYFGEREAVVETARKLLARRPADGSNRIIVAHGNIAQEATDVYPGEGEVIIFKPDGKGDFAFVGRISPDRWGQLGQGR